MNQFSSDLICKAMLDNTVVTHACTPDECQLDVNEYGDVDEAIVQCAKLLDRLELVRGEGDPVLDDAYTDTRRMLTALIDSYMEHCDPRNITTQPIANQPRVTCKHGMHDSWEAYAPCDPLPASGGIAEVDGVLSYPRGTVQHPV